MMKTKSRLLRAAEVVERVGLSRVTIWRREREGDFPRRVRLGGNSVGWLESDIEAWIETRPYADVEQDS